MFNPALSVKIVDCMGSDGSLSQRYDYVSLFIFGYVQLIQYNWFDLYFTLILFVCLFIYLYICANRGISGVICLTILIGTFVEYISSTKYSHISKIKCVEQEIDFQSEVTESINQQILYALSIRKNLKKIFTVKATNNNSSSNDSITEFHGIKFFAMIWIILSHSISFSSQWINFSKCVCLL